MSKEEEPQKKAEEEDEDGIEPEPLLPSDPSAALLRCQGHYLVHLALYLGAQIFVTPDYGDFYCIETDANDEYKVKSQDTLAVNETYYQLMYMHLICFVLVFAADMYVSAQLSTNVVAAQKLAYFTAIGLYLVVSIKAQLVYRAVGIGYKEGATAEVYHIKDVCFATEPGTVAEWTRIEIAAFYIQLVLMVVVLFKSRLSDVSEAKAEVKEMRAKYMLKDRVFEMDLGEGKGKEKVVLYNIQTVDAEQVKAKLEKKAKRPLTLQDYDIGGEMAGYPVYFDKHQNLSDDKELVQKWLDRKGMGKLEFFKMVVILTAFRISRMLYITIYYYFLPFLVICLVQFGTFPIKI